MLGFEIRERVKWILPPAWEGGFPLYMPRNGNFPLLKAFALQATEKQVLNRQGGGSLLDWSPAHCVKMPFFASQGDEAGGVTKGDLQPNCRSRPSAALQILSDPTPVSSVTFKYRRRACLWKETQQPEEQMSRSVVLEIKQPPMLLLGVSKVKTFQSRVV